MVFVKTDWGGFHEPPYTAEENWEFEQRLRRGGDITIIRQRKPDRPPLLASNRPADFIEVVGQVVGQGAFVPKISGNTL